MRSAISFLAVLLVLGALAGGMLYSPAMATPGPRPLTRVAGPDDGGGGDGPARELVRPREREPAPMAGQDVLVLVSVAERGGVCSIAVATDGPQAQLVAVKILR